MAGVNCERRGAGKEGNSARRYIAIRDEGDGEKGTA